MRGPGVTTYDGTPARGGAPPAAWYMYRMGRSSVDVRARSAAAPEAVYALLVDGASWPTWSGHDSFELVEPGRDGGESPGAVRIFRRRPVASPERVVELLARRRGRYVLPCRLPASADRHPVDPWPA